MNEAIRMLDDEVRRERIYVILLAVFLAGASAGAIFCAVIYHTGIYTLSFAWCESFLKCFAKHLIWLLLIGILSLYPSGAGLIPLVFFVKGMIASCRAAGIMLFAEESGLYEAMLLCLPDILFFLLVGSLVAERGMENALALWQKRPAFRVKNLYVLANRRVTAVLAAILTLTSLETVWEVCLTPFFIK